MDNNTTIASYSFSTLIRILVSSEIVLRGICKSISYSITQCSRVDSRSAWQYGIEIIVLHSFLGCSKIFNSSKLSKVWRINKPNIERKLQQWQCGVEIVARLCHCGSWIGMALNNLQLSRFISSSSQAQCSRSYIAGSSSLSWLRLNGPQCTIG